jgi:4-amino-4-deoxy-L-arabinose transferase-like glycosyltransferase
LILGAIMLGMTLLHLNAQRVNHTEGDEAVFLFLAERLSAHPFQYNVQGELHGEQARRFVRDAVQPLADHPLPEFESFSLIWGDPDASGERTARFEPAIYDRPLFFHPPLYPYSLMVARWLAGAAGGILLSSLFHAATVLCVALIGRMLANPAVGLMAGALMAVESVSWTCAERLWTDGMLQMTVTIAALAALWATRKGGVWRFIVAGACLGLAGLTKLPAGLLAPAVLAMWFLSDRTPRINEIIGYVLVCSALVFPWMLLSKALYGSYLPSERPTIWMQATSAWVRLVMHRPEWYYVFGLLLVSPIFLYCIGGVSRLRWDDWLWIPVAWAGAFLVALTVIGAQGMGYQLRYLSPALPAMCLLAAAGAEIVSPRWRWPLVLLAAYTLYVGITTGLQDGIVDPQPDALAHLLKRLFGWDFRQAIPGVWWVK